MTEWGDHIVCPYCGYEDEEYTDYPVSLRRDGDETTYDCTHCERTFSVTLNVDYSYRSAAISGESADVASRTSESVPREEL